MKSGKWLMPLIVVGLFTYYACLSWRLGGLEASLTKLRKEDVEYKQLTEYMDALANWARWQQMRDECEVQP